MTRRLSPILLLSLLSLFPLQAQEIHVVERNQTLYSLSRLYRVSVQELQTWNNLSSNTIHPGQRLVVSAPQLAQEAPASWTGKLQCCCFFSHWSPAPGFGHCQFTPGKYSYSSQSH